MPVLALGPGGVILVLGILAAVYVAGAYPLFRIAKQTTDRTDDAWLAFIPIASLVLMCRLARVSAWCVLLFVVAFIVPFGVFGWLLFMWIRIGQRFDRVGLSILAGVLPVIGAYLFAFMIEPERAVS